MAEVCAQYLEDIPFDQRHVPCLSCAALGTPNRIGAIHPHRPDPVGK